MKSARVLRNGELVGILEKSRYGTYTFTYDDGWYQDSEKPAVSLTLPKSAKKYSSDHLFPFFFNMLSEGVNLKLQARQYQVDEDDFFTLLLLTANYDTIGRRSFLSDDAKEIYKDTYLERLKLFNYSYLNLKK